MPFQTAAPNELAALPDTPAVFVLRMIQGGEPYVAKTKRLRSRLMRLLETHGSESKKLSLAGKVERIEYECVFSEFEARWTLYQTLKREFPTGYQRKLRLRGAPHIRIGWSNPFPRAAVTRRIGVANDSAYFGPFRSRKDAEAAMHAALDLYAVRRCVEDLAPDTAHPGCVYGEMKMCLAPCQLRITQERYLEEVHAFEAFLATLGENQLEQLAHERQKATDELAFEQAAALHAKWQRYKTAAQAFPDCIRRIDQWHAVMLQPGSSQESVRIFCVHAGCIAPMREISLAEAHGGGLRQLGAALRNALDSIPEPHCDSSPERQEHLTLLQKWLYANPKTRRGELVLADHDRVISTRRLAHAAERILKPLASSDRVEGNSGI